MVGASRRDRQTLASSEMGLPLIQRLAQQVEDPDQGLATDRNQDRAPGCRLNSVPARDEVRGARATATDDGPSRRSAGTSQTRKSPSTSGRAPDGCFTAWLDSRGRFSGNTAAITTALNGFAPSDVLGGGESPGVLLL